MRPLIGPMPQQPGGVERDPLVPAHRAQWADLPERYPPHQTCHRRFQRWVRDGTLERILEALARDLKERGKLDLSECFIDDTFVAAKGGGCVVQPSGAKVRSSWQWQTALVFLSPCVPPRLRLTRRSSPLLFGDRAYDADPLDAALAQLGIEMIAPQRRSRVRPMTRDGRSLRRYRRRWKIKRLFAWLGNFRRLVVRYEHSAHNYLGFVHLGCILILLRQAV